MSEPAITRQDMANAMSADFNADIIENPVRNWRRVSTVVADQGDMIANGSILDFHMVELALQGKHILHIEGELEGGDHLETSLLPGALAYTQPDIPVSIEGQGRASLQQIYIDKATFRDVAESIAPGDPDKLKTLGFQGVFEPKVKHLAQLILDEARRPSAGDDLYTDLLAQQIALLILRRRLEGNEKKLSIRPLSSTEIGRVIAYMEDNLDDVGGLNTLASIIDMDVFVFARAFKAATGQAPHSFLIERRLSRAQDLLVHTKTPLADIAYQCGFSSQSHMTARFSKQFGVPPGTYRKQA